MSNSRGGRRGPSNPESYGRANYSNGRWSNPPNAPRMPCFNSEPPDPTQNHQQHFGVWGAPSNWWPQQEPAGFGWNSMDQNWAPQYYNPQSQGPHYNEFEFEFGRGGSQYGPRGGGPRFPERSLAHLNQASAEQLAAGGSSSRGRNERRGYQSASRGVDRKFNPCNVRDPSHRNSSGDSTRAASPPTLGPSAGFLCPNTDLTNKIKASLKNKDHNNSTGTSSAIPSTSQSSAVPATVKPSPGRTRESRVSVDHNQTPAAAPNPAPAEPAPPVNKPAARQERRRRSSCQVVPTDVLDGVGFIQGSSEKATDDSHAGGSGGDQAVTAITKEHLNRCIKSMDNHQRRLLVEHPDKAKISQVILDKMTQEHQTAKARQLSAMRFGTCSSDNTFNEVLDPARVEGTVQLSDALMDSVMELLMQDNTPAVAASTAAPPTPSTEDDEIVILPPPVKEQPPCIDLDCDEGPPSNVTAELDPVDHPVHEEKPGTSAEEEPKKTEPRSQAEAKTPVPSSSTDEGKLAVMEPMEVVPQPASAQNFLLEDLRQEERQYRERISIIDHEMEKLLKERKSLNDKVADLMQRQFDFLRSDLPVDGGTKPSPQVAIKDCPAVNLPPVAQAQVSTQSVPKQAKPNDAKVAPRKSSSGASASSTPQRPTPEQVTLTDSPVSSSSVQKRKRDPNSSAVSVEKSVDASLKSPVPKRKTSEPLPSAQPSNATAPASGSGKSKRRRPRSRSSNRHRVPSYPGPLEPSESEVPKDVAAHQNSGKSVPPNNDKPSQKKTSEGNGTQQQSLPAKPVGSCQQPRAPSMGSVPLPQQQSLPAKPVGPSQQPRAPSMGPAPLPQQQSRPANPGAVTKVATPAVSTAGASNSVTGSKQDSKAQVLAVSRGILPTLPGKAKERQDGKPTTSAPVAQATPVLGKQEGTAPKPPVIPAAMTKTVPSSTSLLPPAAPARPAYTSAPTAIKAISVPPPQPLPPPRATAGSNSSSQTKKVTAPPAPTPSAPTPPAPTLPVPIPTSTGAKRNGLLPTPAIPPAAAQPSQSSALPTPAHQTPPVAGGRELRYLEKYTSGIASLFVTGPCLFTAYDDGRIHVYDLISYELKLRILGHTQPVPWLYALSLDANTKILKSLSNFPTEYSNHLTLITGSHDGYIRQFDLRTTDLKHDLCVGTALTCMTANVRDDGRLYVGSRDGAIHFYNPKLNQLTKASFKAESEVLCLKVSRRFRGRKASVIVVAARRSDPVIYDLKTEAALVTLKCGMPSASSIYAISASNSYIYCCDATKNVFTFNTEQQENPLVHTDSLPSPAVNSFHDGKRFMLMACMDGVIRLMDTQRKSWVTMKDLPGEHMKNMTCMQVSDGKVVCGNLQGEITCRPLITDLSSLFPS